MQSADFVTDTSTLCIFDLESLRHRLDDDSDWWTVPDEELLEVNNGNIAFIGLGEDGKYCLEVCESLVETDISINLNCPSGRLFIGAGEEVTGEGLEPEALRGGMFLDLSPGIYRLAIYRKSPRLVAICFEQTSDGGENKFTTPVQI
ncbi:DUF6386 family protein [Blastopirellula retiformator]|uniref:Uncharacterized protein n=1 Tax=Blastopirellula retiformator TaxID=2527970 RepID=A0A5C5VLJ7_9BACT|nr:DUF6386 family protein [Blastopirellula retiformator]TWT38820.1 hypothetical protein Enr8_05140 [Blastopirellula retiformator]